MTKSAFDKIAHGLREALEVSKRGLRVRATIVCDDCGNVFGADDKRGGPSTCPLCWVMRTSSASWSYRNDCEGLFGEAFSFKREAERALAKERATDQSPDWRVVPVVMIELPKGSFGEWNALEWVKVREKEATP